MPPIRLSSEGLAGFIQKPYRQEALRKLLHRLLACNNRSG